MGNVVNQDRGIAYNLRVWGNITPNLTTSLSYYASDQSDRTANDGSSLFGNQAPASTVLSNNITDPLVGSNLGIGYASPGMPGSGTASDLTAYQLDLGYEAMGNYVSGYYGMVEDGVDANNQEWTYYSLELARDLTPQTYIGARYGSAENEESATPTINSEFEKISVGLGHNLNPNTLAKLEYLQQENTSSNSEAEFDGIIGQMADVRNILHVADSVSQVAQVSHHHIKRDITFCMTQVGIPINCGAADIDANKTLFNRFKLFFFTT
jgi:hypothetical protein